MLPAKQETFCQKNILDLCATQTAIRAGFSEKTAQAIGHENLTKPDVADRIAELQASGTMGYLAKLFRVADHVREVSAHLWGREKRCRG